MATMVALGACSPAHDWRDVRPSGTQVQLQFPCRPVAQQRAVPLAGPAVSLSLLACTAGGQTYALAHADMADPARVGPALAELRRTTVAKLPADQVPARALSIPGATPNEHSGRLQLQGRAASAARGAVKMELVLFAHGTQVFQASVLGETVPADAAETFFSSIGFPR